MKTSVFGVLVALCSMESMAACPPVDALVKEYGISYWGFQKPIPPFTDTAKLNWPKKDILSIVLPTPDHVNDAFLHTITINPETKEAWISRTGGLAGVNEMYGPISMAGVEGELKSCVPAKSSNMTMNSGEDPSLTAARYQ